MGGLLCGDYTADLTPTVTIFWQDESPSPAGRGQLANPEIEARRGRY